MKKLCVAIPLKTNSSRVPNKTLRPFWNNKSLFDIKAEQLLKELPPEDVYVSSEDPNVEKIVHGKYGFNFLLRDTRLTPNSAPWTDVVGDIVSQLPENTDVMCVQVTQPLFDQFREVREKWEHLSEDYDSLVVTKKFSHHLLDSTGLPVNFSFGYWHKISQELPVYHLVTWACFVMRYEMVMQTHYQIGRSL